MLTQKTLLPPEQRVLAVGWTDGGQLVLCFKYFAAPGEYDGFFPFSFFDPPLKTLNELEVEIVKHFGMDYSQTDGLSDSEKLGVLKGVLTR